MYTVHVKHKLSMESKNFCDDWPFTPLVINLEKQTKKNRYNFENVKNQF